MTRDEILALTAGREADAVAHRTIFNEEPIPSTGWIVGEYSVRDGDGLCWLPHYTDCRNAAALVLAEVERRGRIEQFVDDLTDVVGCSMALPEWHYDEAWMFLSATPLQLAQAALLAIANE